MSPSDSESESGATGKDPSVKINFKSSLPHREVGSVLGKRHRDKDGKVIKNANAIIKVEPGGVTDALKEKLFYEIFTSLKYLDSLDNGFSIMFRIPGTLPVEVGTLVSHAEIEATKLTITAYINSQWLNGINADGEVARCLQIFASGVACRHLRHLRSLYRENNAVMKTFAPSPVLDDGSPFIPPPETDHPCHYKLRAFRPGILNARLDKLDEDEFDSMAEDYDWMGLGELADKLEAEESNAVTASTVNSDAKQNLTALPERKKKKFSKGPIVSIGTHTDQALDLLKFKDGYIHYLYVLATTVRSSRWTEVLQGPEFALTSEQATIISAALLEDAKAAMKLSIKDVKIEGGYNKRQCGCGFCCYLLKNIVYIVIVVFAYECVLNYLLPKFL